MLDDVTNYFYKLGYRTACAKVGASLIEPDDQTPQVHREVMSPATNGPEGCPADEVNDAASSTTTQGPWQTHDQRVQQGTGFESID